MDALCYPQLAAAFPHWPGFLLWSRTEAEGKIVLLNASGLLGRHKAVIAFGSTGQTLLVRGEVQLLPEPSQQDFTIIAMD